MTKSKVMAETEINSGTLKECLMESTKDMLMHAAQIFGLKVPTSLKKEAVADAIADKILSSPQKFLEGLTTHELYMVKSICAAGERNVINAPIMECQMSLYKLGILCMYDRVDIKDFEMYDLPTDLKQVLKGHVEEVEKRKKEEKESVLETIVMGYLNIFGIMAMKEFVEFIAKQMNMQNDEVEAYLRGRYLLSDGIFKFAGDYEFISSPFLFEDYRKIIIESITKYEGIDYNVNATSQTIIQWGIMPFPVDHVPYARKLLALLEKNMGKAGQAEVALTQFWVARQISPHSSSVISDLVNSANIKNIKELQNVMDEIVTFNNKMPQWIFCGHSSEEVSKMRYGNTPNSSPIHFPAGNSVFGIKPQFSHYGDNADFEAALYKGVNPETGKKIRPNDPCPCGSGKKYKKCHGRLSGADRGSFLN